MSGHRCNVSREEADRIVRDVERLMLLVQAEASGRVIRRAENTVEPTGIRVADADADFVMRRSR